MKERKRESETRKGQDALEETSNSLRNPTQRRILLSLQLKVPHLMVGLSTSKSSSLPLSLLHSVLPVVAEQNKSEIGVSSPAFELSPRSFD